MEKEVQKGGEKKGGKRDSNNEKEDDKKISGKKIVLLLLLGVLIGVFLKTQVFGSIVVGYNDNKLNSLKSDFNYEEYEKKKAAAEEKAAAERQANPEGAQQVETAPATGGQCGN